MLHSLSCILPSTRLLPATTRNHMKMNHPSLWPYSALRWNLAERTSRNKWVDATIVGMELISGVCINSWGISPVDWMAGELFVVGCKGFLSGDPVPDLLHHVPLPHIAFRCWTRITHHSLTSEHTTHTMDSTALHCTYVYIVLLCS